MGRGRLERSGGEALKSNPDKVKKFQESLLQWHEQEKRKFPWRETADPYAVLLAEFLLQKTDAKKAESAYEKLIKRYPSPATLARARDRDLEAVFRSIGLVYRAIRVKKVAVDIVEKHSGKVPENSEELLSLFGVGEYIANAVLCFAYGRAVALVDSPISRVLARVFEFKSAKKRIREDEDFWRFAESLVPSNSPRKYHFALLDFANAICTLRKPKCRNCCLRNICSSWFE